MPRKASAVSWRSPSSSYQYSFFGSSSFVVSCVPSQYGMFADRPQPQIHCDSVPTLTSKGPWRKRLTSLGMRVSSVSFVSVSEKFVGAHLLLRHAGLGEELA